MKKLLLLSTILLSVTMVKAQVKKDTSLVVNLADFRTLNSYLQIASTRPLTDAEMLAIKINLPSIFNHIRLNDNLNYISLKDSIDHVDYYIMHKVLYSENKTGNRSSYNYDTKKWLMLIDSTKTVNKSLKNN